MKKPQDIQKEPDGFKMPENMKQLTKRQLIEGAALGRHIKGTNGPGRALISEARLNDILDGADLNKAGL